MNVLFLTLVKVESLKNRGLYNDLLNEFLKEGHQVYVLNPVERREKKATFLVEEKGAKVLNVKTFNMQKSSILEKGIGTLSIEFQYLSALKKYFSDVKFDLILYSTPPITFSNIISYVKKKDGAFAYLLLKDIFPQNAVDMQMLKKGSLLHRFFLKKEHKLYKISDRIGCMSAANKRYLLTHNPAIPESKVEVNPNSIFPISVNITQWQKENIRSKYNIPLDKKVLVYGGNLGKPQGLEFLLESIESSKNEQIFFLIVGSGTRYPMIKEWFSQHQPKNAILFSALPKDDYDLLLMACDVGLIFLDKNFTIPNFPSRLLSYLEMKMPVIAATDPNTDIGQVLESYQAGISVISGDIHKMNASIDLLCSDLELFTSMQNNAWRLLQSEYTAKNSYELIAAAVKN